MDFLHTWVLLKFCIKFIYFLLKLPNSTSQIFAYTFESDQCGPYSWDACRTDRKSHILATINLIIFSIQAISSIELIYLVFKIDRLISRCSSFKLLTLPKRQDNCCKSTIKQSGNMEKEGRTWGCHQQL